MIQPGKVIGFPSLATTVVCGMHHTVVLLSSGEVFSFGANTMGQLGVGDLSTRFQPARVVLPEKVTQVAAGNFHTLFLTEQHNVYASGNHEVSGPM
ncbi:unnamed protein product [Cyprideis torosa]|uniref:Uncharacterized protein n=1 Tax=Cyprideis torosa TaxID=163714 RepID=A0A7R8ZVQ0_9CRUS|nr:unnamed protein product [Cyprideis torosa]CAG0910919.1 unnamed protein product [Cyprideis torosa]